MELMNILLVVFVIVSFIVLVRSYYPVIRNIIKKKSNFGDEKPKNFVSQISHNLAVLKGKFEPEVKAAAFIGLMDLSYVLVHVMGNEGNNYDDELQSERFKRSLTAEVMERLNAVEGRYE